MILSASTSKGSDDMDTFQYVRCIHGFLTVLFGRGIPCLAVTPYTEQRCLQGRISPCPHTCHKSCQHISASALRHSRIACRIDIDCPFRISGQCRCSGYGRSGYGRCSVRRLLNRRADESRMPLDYYDRRETVRQGHQIIHFGAVPRVFPPCEIQAAD